LVSEIKDRFETNPALPSADGGGEAASVGSGVSVDGTDVAVAVDNAIVVMGGVGVCVGVNGTAVAVISTGVSVGGIGVDADDTGVSLAAGSALPQPTTKVITITLVAITW